MSIAHLLNRTCSIWEIGPLATNGIGGYTQSDTSGAADSTGVRCRIQPAGRSDVKRFERRDLVVGYVIYAAYDAPFDRSWAVKLDGTDPPGATIELEVIDTEHPSRSKHHMKVYLRANKRRPA